ncbi:MAG TPA: CHASE2 domain-containing protein, partial [Dissulfurispiraceae bacterium]|nr:CHASE2 domain-containing protein [Dissulfurispiraceae bacterium]
PVLPSDRIVIVSADDETLSNLGSWPLPRRYYAQLLGRLCEAALVGLDVPMNDPSADDAIFAHAMREHGRVVLPLYLYGTRRVGGPTGLFSPYRSGHVRVEPDVDGVVREVHHKLIVQGQVLYSFASVMYEELTGRSIPGGDSHPERSPGIDRHDLMWINFVGGPGVFPSYSLFDVLSGRYPPEVFRDKIVVVGVTAEGLSDRLFTPFAQERKGTAGVEVQAHILNTLLLANPIWVPFPWLQGASAVGLALLALLFFVKVEERKALLIGMVMLPIVTAALYGLFYQFNLWLRPAAHYGAILAMFLIAYSFKVNEAIRGLDRAYAAMVPRLRWSWGNPKEKPVRRGLGGFFTPGGIHAKTRLLGEVTDQLTFEKELTDRALFSDIQGVVLFDLDGKRVMANDQGVMLCKAHGLDLNDVGCFVVGLAAFVTDNIDLQEVMTQLRTMKGSNTFTISLPAPDKRYLKVDASSLFVGERTYLLFLFSDITKTRELDNLKGQIVSTVSHELKTPLTSIQGLSEILTRKLDGKMREFARIINEEAVRLGHFVDTFLDITRMEAGRQPIKKAPVHLRDLVTEVEALLVPVAEKKGIVIGTDLPIETAAVSMDRDLIKQCLVNLLENAIKYSPQGSDVTVRVTDLGGAVKVDVVDHGYGISEEELNRIFEKFYRARSEQTEAIKGSGLGLTFVKEAVEAQGGQVVAESTPGKGSTFSIVFMR